MKSAPGMGSRAVVRLAMASALLWLACGEEPRGVDGDARIEGLVSLPLQAMADEQWNYTNSPEQARDRHTATLLPSGKVLVAGGYAPAPGSYLASMELYDPATGRWSPAGFLAEARVWHTATLLHSGKVLFVGGGLNLTPLASVEMYDPATGETTSMQPLARARAWHTATLLRSGKVLVTGGIDATGGPISSAEVYDPATNTWNSTGSMANARNRHTATLLLSGKVLVTGGATFPESLPLSEVEVYDPDTGEWSTRNRLIEGRFGHTATHLRSGMVLVAGGRDVFGRMNQVEVYDPDTGAWTMKGTLHEKRAHHTATLLPSGEVLLSGGSSRPRVFAKEEVYAPNADRWRQIDRLEEPRDNHTATLLPSGQVLVTGGYDHDADGYVASAAVYDVLDSSLRPIVEPIVPQKPGASFVVRGTGFIGTHGEPGVVRLLGFPEGVLRYLPTADLLDTSAQVTLVDVPEGHHLLLVVTNGVAGGQILRVDGTPPGTPKVSAPGPFANSPKPVISGTAEAGSTVQVSLGGRVAGTVQASARGGWSFALATALTNGIHSVVATATDAAGNVGPPSETHNFTVDTLPPAPPEVNTPEPFIKPLEFVMSGTAEAGSTVEVRLNGNTAGNSRADESGAWRFTPLQLLADNLYRAEAIARDNAGNPSLPSLVHSFTVDSVAPPAPQLRVPETFVITQQPIINGTSAPESIIEVRLDGMVAGTVQADTKGTWSIAPDMELELGRHVVVATAKDEAGNTSIPSAEYSFRIAQQSHYGWGCGTAQALPTTWALLALAWLLGPAALGMRHTQWRKAGPVGRARRGPGHVYK